MSNFSMKTINPNTNEEEDAEWLDNYFGRHYGIRFKDGSIHHELDIKIALDDEENKRR